MSDEALYEKLGNDGILMEHNKIPYINVKKMFEEKNKVCIERATGTGKAFIALQLMYDNPNKKIIYLVPRLGLGDQVEEYMLSLSSESRKKYFPNVQIKTYQSLLNMTRKELEELEVDYLITDEHHHIISPEWGHRINIIDSSHPNLKIFGMTATPIRGLGTSNEENVSETFFNGNVASRLTLAQAISQGILVAPKYVTVNYNYEEDIRILEEKLKNKIMSDEQRLIYLKKIEEAKEKAKKIVAKAPSFEDVLKNNLKPNGKYIVFCPRGTLDKTMNDAINGWLPNITSLNDINVYYATSYKPKISRKNQREFYHDHDNNKLRIMFAMDMYNEGIHVPDIDGVIMLRPTKSDIVFQQHLGRAIACTSEKTLVLDFVNNIRTIMKLSREVKDLVRQGKLDFSQMESQDSELMIDFNITEEELELFEIIEELERKLSLTITEKIAEFIEMLNNPLNQDVALTSEKCREKEFSNGDKVGQFWWKHKNEIKEELNLNPKYEIGYNQAKKVVFPALIYKVSEYIEMINNPLNKAITLKGKETQSKEFSNGDKVGQFWNNHKEEIKKELSTNPKYEVGYDQAKSKVFPKIIDKIFEYIEIINDPLNKNVALKGEDIQEKEFSNGDKIGQFWGHHKVQIREELSTNPKYKIGYDQAKARILLTTIDKISEYIEILNTPLNKDIALKGKKIQNIEFSNGERVGQFWRVPNKAIIREELSTNPKYKTGYEQAKRKVFYNDYEIGLLQECDGLYSTNHYEDAEQINKNNEIGG